MKCLIASLFLASTLLAAPPTVSNISFLYGSHSSVQVVFTVSSAGNAYRLRYIPTAQGTCDNGNPAATVQQFNLTAFTGLTVQLPVSGLAFATQYQFCPEASNDGGNTWSSTGGSNPSGADFTTLPRPLIHPALPIHPATFDTSYPDTTLGTCWSTGQPGYCVITETVGNNTCPNLAGDINTAIAHLQSSGTIDQVPAGSICTNQFNAGQMPPDAIQFSTTAVANNTITLANYGLSEGQGVVFANFSSDYNGYYPYINGPVDGYVYFVHRVDVNNFQLYQNWEQRAGSEETGSNVVTVPGTWGWASSPGISVGEEIVGAGIPAGTTIASISSDQTLLVLSASATATASNVTFTFGGPLLPIGACSVNCAWHSGNSYFVPWPRLIPYWVIVRTSTPDSQFAPVGTRVHPAWGPKMATFEATFATDTHHYNQLFGTGPFMTHVRFVGIHWTWAPTTEIASDPAPDQALITTADYSSDIVFDRNWFDGPPAGNEDRVWKLIYFNGMDVAIKDSYWDNLAYWHASYTWPGRSGVPTQSSQVPTGTAGSTAFTVPVTTVHYGAPNPASLSAPLTVSWTGTPTATTTKPEIAVYFDMTGALQIAAPQGLTVTASAGTVSYTANSGSGSCTEGDALIPSDTQGHEAAAPLGCAVLNASGQIASLAPGTIYWGPGTEGCQCLIGGVGPGPYEVSNNYISGSGLIVHFDNSGGRRWRGDYLVRRNRFHILMKYLNSSGNRYARQAGIPSNGYSYGNRQVLEWKGGEREWIDGNIFDGGFADVNHGAPFDVTAHSGDSYGITDMDVTNNTIEHYPFGMGVETNVMDNNGNILPMVNARYRAYNNLLWDINGFVYSTSDCTNFGVACLGAGTFAGAGSGGPGEDLIIDHNTLYDITNGVYGNFWDTTGAPNSYPQEGVDIENNIIPYGLALNGQDLFVMAFSNMNSSTCKSGQLYNEGGADCAWIAGAGNPDYVFAGNLLIPAWSQPQYPEGGGQVPVSRIQTDWPKWWNQNTVMAQSGVLAALAAVGWTSPNFTRSWNTNGDYTGTVPDFHLLSQSLYNCCQTTDGLPEGADLDRLEAAQGQVVLVGANHITGSSASIAYFAPDSDACSVDYSSTDPTLISSFARVFDSGGSRMRQVTLSGLSVRTAYRYRVNCQVQQPTGEFRTN